jgi:hypothetical protein
MENCMLDQHDDDIYGKNSETIEQYIEDFKSTINHHLKDLENLSNEDLEIRLRCISGECLDLIEDLERLEEE